MGDKVKLNVVIDELMFENQDIDSYLHNTKREHIIFHIRNAWQQLALNGNMAGQINARELPLENGWYVTLPDDYVRYVRVSGVTECGKLLPLYVDETMNIASSYLRDNNGVLLLDVNDDPLLDSGTGVGNTSCSLVSTADYSSYSDSYGYCGSNYGGQWDLATGVNSIYGQYRIDKENRIIQIANSPFTSFVLEYVADLTEYTPFKDMEVEKVWKEVLKNYVYWKVLSRRRNVAGYEKQLAEKEYRRTVKDAQLKSAPSLQEWRQIMNRNY